MLDFVTRELQPVQAGLNEFILSDGEPDRMGDIIEPDGWQIGKFSPICLLNHGRDQIIGKWNKVRIEKKELRGELALAEQGTSPVVDMVRALFDQGLLDTVSVGFRAIEREPIDPKDPFGPQRFTKAELVEASLVSVPANPRARRIAKQFLPEDQYRRLCAAPGVGDFPRAKKPGKPAETKPVRKEGLPMEAVPIGKRIEQNEAKLVSLKDKLTEIDKLIAEQEAPTEEQSLEVEAINGEIASTEKALTTLKNIEAGLAVKVVANTPQRPNIVAPFQPKKLMPRDYIFRAMTCAVIAHVLQKQGKKVVASDILKERYHNDEATELVLKAAVQPGSTTVQGWASELVGTAIADFLESLALVAIYPRLAALGPRYTFGAAGIIKVPSRASTPKINGSFVGEGQPIPVRRLGLTSISLTPKKMAVISEFTKELDIHSTPSIESVVRQAINEDTAEAIDTVLIDTTAADTIRPAGLRNGVSGLTPSTATAAYDKMIADIKALINAITGARGGRSLVLLVNPAQALSLEWVTIADGSFPFDSVRDGELRGLTVVSSATVPATMLIMVDAADFASVTADTPEFDVSDQATIHEEDTTPLPIGTAGTPNVVAAPTRSLWQTYSIGIRMVLPMNWAMRRTGMVAWMTGVTW